MMSILMLLVFLMVLFLIFILSSLVFCFTVTYNVFGISFILALNGLSGVLLIFLWLGGLISLEFLFGFFLFLVFISMAGLCLVNIFYL